MGKYLVKNCDIASFDDLNVRRKDILVENGRFTKIDDHIVCDDACVIDAKGKLAIPGFTDAHTHMYQTFLKGPLDDYPITDWLFRMFGILDIMTEEEWYYSTYLGCLSSLRFGTTTINDMGDFRYHDAILQAFEDSGIRATAGVNTTDISENPLTPLMSIDEALRRSEIIYSKAHGRNNGLIKASVAPAGLPAVSKDLSMALKSFANEKGIVFHSHLGEGKKETEDVMRMYGLRGECEAMYEFGLLDKNTLLAHSIWLEDFEIDLIKKSGATPVHCPNTNMKISDGIPKIAKMLKAGINVAVGCDGEASSSTRDMIREGRAGAYLQKAVTLDPTVMDAGTTFKMMTVNGARALGYEDVGEIKVGNRADLVLVNMEDDVSLVGHEFRIGNLLYAGDGHAVDTVFCDGVMKVSNKQLVDVKEQEVINKCRSLVSDLNKRIVERM